MSVRARRIGARAAGVGARLRLGERPAAEIFALRQRHHIFLPLRLGAKFVDVVGAQRIVRRDDQCRPSHPRATSSSMTMAYST